VSDGIRSLTCVCVFGGEGVSHHVRKNTFAGQNLRTGLSHASCAWVYIVLWLSDQNPSSVEKMTSPPSYVFRLYSTAFLKQVSLMQWFKTCGSQTYTLRSNSLRSGQKIWDMLYMCSYRYFSKWRYKWEETWFFWIVCFLYFVLVAYFGLGSLQF
jgi:hypothetical protein